MQKIFESFVKYSREQLHSGKGYWNDDIRLCGITNLVKRILKQKFNFNINSIWTPKMHRWHNVRKFCERDRKELIECLEKNSIVLKNKIKKHFTEKYGWSGLIMRALSEHNFYNANVEVLVDYKRYCTGIDILALHNDKLCCIEMKALGVLKRDGEYENRILNNARSIYAHFQAALTTTLLFLNLKQKHLNIEVPEAYILWLYVDDYQFERVASTFINDLVQKSDKIFV